VKILLVQELHKDETKIS